MICVEIILIWMLIARIQATESIPCSLPSSLDKKLKMSPALKQVYSEGDELTFTCVRDHVLNGNQYVTCTNSGWNTEFPSCRKIQSCILPGFLGKLVTVIPAGKVEYREGEQLVFGCPPGHRNVGSLVCQESGWIGRTPTCLKIATCILPSILDDKLRVIPSGKVDYREGDQVVFGCPSGHLVIGNLVCRNSGWHGHIPTCLSASENFLREEIKSLQATVEKQNERMEFIENVARKLTSGCELKISKSSGQMTCNI